MAITNMQSEHTREDRKRILIIGAGKSQPSASPIDETDNVQAALDFV